MKSKSFLLIAIGCSLLCSCANDGAYTRGIGVYPGDVDQVYAPAMVSDNSTYRNVALLKSAYHSSSFDYNLTAQLVTDGIISTTTPNTLVLSTQEGVVSRTDKEKMFDSNSYTNTSFSGGSNAMMQLQFLGQAPEVTRMALQGTVTCNGETPQGYDLSLEASVDGTQWTVLKREKGSGLPGRTSPPRQRQGFGMQPRQQGEARPAQSNVRHPYGPGMPGVSGGMAPQGGAAARPAGTASPNTQGDALMQQQMQQLQQMQRAMNSRRQLQWSVDIPAGQTYAFYRVVLNAPNATTWAFTEWDLFDGAAEMFVSPSHRFESAWMSAQKGQQWVYVDLGAPATFDRVTLHWISKAIEGEIQVSDDAQNWTAVGTLPGGSTLVDDLEVTGHGRYVRVLMNKAANGSNYTLSELEVFGKGGLVPQPHKALEPTDDTYYLSGGHWTLQRANLVAATGNDISKPGFDASQWVVATVPATVLTSYRNVGAIPDPNYADNQFQISESFFNSNFWYRNEFEIPASYKGKSLFLNFDGINWKANVFVNGTLLGRIEGAFTSGKFDITALAKYGESNAVAVEIIKNEHFGIVKEQTRQSADINGGVLGADNPTFHASIGWDWIPSIRGRNMGIWNDVFLTANNGGVTIEEPFVTTDLPLPATDYADIHVETVLDNHNNTDVTGTLHVSYGPLSFSQKVALAAGSRQQVVMEPARLDNPKLWWPNGYGEPYLYDVIISFDVDGTVSDTKSFKSGVREMTYDDKTDVLDIYINGRRLIGNGGNWGFSESNLNYRAREYDIAVAYHADMHFTMIRNWVGQTGDQEFYEACDRHGIMVWQDFWLANPSDGPNPDDNALFMANAYNYVKRIRNHPSIAIYVGRNEGNPPEEINNGLVKLVADLHPGLYYIPHSSSGFVSGNGPYRALPVEEYFSATRGFDRIHSERGMPNVMTYESMTRMLPASQWWPQTSQWGVHDYTMANAQSCASFNELIKNGFGEPTNLKEFTERAQWINYNGYRAMYESRSWNRKGLLIWMSHSAWPSMVWDTYDYYFEPSAAYFGSKKGSAPIRIQWNPVSTQVEVVNNNALDQNGLTATARVLTYEGTTLFEKTVSLDSPDDTTTELFPLSFDIDGLTDVYFIKLELKKDNQLLADNFYWEGKEAGNYRLLNTLPKIELQKTDRIARKGDGWVVTTTVKNTTATPALMVRLKVAGKQSGESILPVFYQDNYFSLLPGEEKQVTITFKQEDTRGEKPEVILSGFNIE